MEQLGIDQATAFKIQLAVDEACTNITKHAYSEQKGIISLSLELTGSDLTIIIRDRGEPFDHSSVPPPDLEADLYKRKIGGLGVHFMKTLMDEVSYNLDTEKGNELTMRKRLQNTNLEI